MTTRSDALEPLAAMEVTVYHGTRQSLAASILQDGIRPTPVAEQGAVVAQRYGVPLPAIRDHLAAKGRFSTADPDRAGTVSTTADSYAAGSWAVRAPEATWDALRAVFVLTHPHLADDDAMSAAADFWVMAQRVDDPPVVVELRSKLGALGGHGFSAGESAMETIRREFAAKSATQGAVQALTAAVDGFFGFLFQATREWRIPVDRAEVVSISEPVPFRVPTAQLAFLADQSVVELGPPHVRDAVWGPPGNAGRPGGEWWPFDRVWSLLSPQRRAELEEFAGRSIG